jgi:hypothetical protein
MSVVVAALVYHDARARYSLPDHLPLVLFLSLALGPAFVAAGRLRRTIVVLCVLALARWAVVSWQIGLDPGRASIPPCGITWTIAPTGMTHAASCSPTGFSVRVVTA